MPDLTCRLLLAAMASGLLPAGPQQAPEPAERVSLAAHAEPEALRRAYALPVVEVPGLPPARTSSTSRRESGCPVQVKAIVASDDRNLSFVVVAIGSDSKVLHPGDGAAVGNSFVAATDIQPGRVTLQRGRVTYRCQLARGPAAAGPSAPEAPSSSFISSLSIPEVTRR